MKDLEQLYNVLMWEIEPEMTTWVLPDLDSLYKNETPEERSVRYSWYATALELFSERFTEFINQYKSQIQVVKKHLIEAGENADAKDQAALMHNIERSLQDA